MVVLEMIEDARDMSVAVEIEGESPVDGEEIIQ